MGASIQEDFMRLDAQHCHTKTGCQRPGKTHYKNKQIMKEKEGGKQKKNSQKLGQKSGDCGTITFDSTLLVVSRMSAPKKLLNQVGVLVIVVLKAINLPDRHKFSKQDPFCVVKLTNSGKCRTVIDKGGGQTPLWDEQFELPFYDTPGQKLKLEVWADEIGNPDLLGEAEMDITLPLKDPWTNNEFDEWVKISLDGKQRGEVYLEMTFYPQITTLPSPLPPPKSAMHASLKPGIKPPQSLPTPLPKPPADKPLPSRPPQLTPGVGGYQPSSSQFQRRESKLDPSFRLARNHTYGPFLPGGPKIRVPTNAYHSEKPFIPGNLPFPGQQAETVQSGYQSQGRLPFPGEVESPPRLSSMTPFGSPPSAYHGPQPKPEHYHSVPSAIRPPVSPPIFNRYPTPFPLSSTPNVNAYNSTLPPNTPPPRTSSTSAPPTVPTLAQWDPPIRHQSFEDYAHPAPSPPQLPTSPQPYANIQPSSSPPDIPPPLPPASTRPPLSPEWNAIRTSPALPTPEPISLAPSVIRSDSVLSVSGSTSPESETEPEAIQHNSSAGYDPTGRPTILLPIEMSISDEPTKFVLKHEEQHLSTPIVKPSEVAADVQKINENSTTKPTAPSGPETVLFEKLTQRPDKGKGIETTRNATASTSKNPNPPAEDKVAFQQRLYYERIQQERADALFAAKLAAEEDEHRSQQHRDKEEMERLSEQAARLLAEEEEKQQEDDMLGDRKKLEAEDERIARIIAQQE